MDNKGIGFQMNIDPKSLELTADSELIEQVVINLLLNAIEAVQEQTHPRVELTSGMDDRGRCFIQVSDNGPGILEEVQEKIFIPFFTTKPEGSGIGLSFSRQVMRLRLCRSFCPGSQPGPDRSPQTYPDLGRPDVRTAFSCWSSF